MRRSISQKQFIYLIILNNVGLAILISPSVLAILAEKDAYIAMAAAMVAAPAAVLLHYHLIRTHPGFGLTEMMESILGKWAGKTMMLIYIAAYPYFISALVIRTFGEFVKWALLPNTPQIFIISLFAINIVLLARYGVATAAYAAQMVFWPFILLSFMLLVCLLPQADLHFLLPIGESGFVPILQGTGLSFVFPLTESFAFLTLVPYLDNTKGLYKAMITGTLVSGVILLAFTLMALMILGVELVSLVPFPTYLMAKKISIGDFFERLEAFMFVIWYVTIFFRAAFYFMVSCIGIAKTLNLQTHKSIALPLAICLIGFSLITIHNPYDFHRATAVWFYYASVWTVLLPLFLLAVYYLKKVFTKKKPLSAQN